MAVRTTDYAADDLRAATGISGLDDVLGGGFPQGHFFLLEGVPGTGKTTVGLQFLMAGAKLGESVLYVTLSESVAEIQKVARSHEWSLENMTIFEFTPTEESLRPEDQYSAFHPSEIELQDTTQTILNKVEEVQPKRVVLDSLSEVRLLARDSLRYRRQILALKHFFTNRNCTVVLLDDRTSSQHDLRLQSIAHGVLSLEKVQRDFGATRRRLQVEKMRGSIYREGYHDYVIKTGGVVVFPRLVAGEHRAKVEEEGTITSGIAAFDALWGNGIDRGSSTLFVGPAGCGKSSIAMGIAVAAARNGEAASMFLFEEWARTACKRAKQLGIDPTPYLAAGKLFLEQIDPAELSPGEFVQHVRDSVEKRAAKVIIIDSLNGFVNAMPGEQYLPMQMHELLSYLGQRGVTTILVLAQSGMIGTTAAPFDLSYLADNVLLFRFFEAAGKIRKALSVVKKRAGVHEETIRELSFGSDGIAVGLPLAEFRGVLTGVPTYVGSQPTLSAAADER